MLRLPRAAGVLLHPTSLPGPDGIGDLGDDAHRFLDFLAEAGLTLWQMLPLGPTGYGDSPYACYSAFAGNPLLIACPPGPAVSGPAATGPALSAPALPADHVDFPRVIAHKRARLDALVADFRADDAFHAFVEAQGDWLDDYALFAALKAAHDGAAWTAWEPGAALRAPRALAAWRARLAPAVRRAQVEQYLFFTQFHAVRRAAAAQGIRLMGDLPIYVAHDSADVWAHRALFQLHPDGRPSVQAGVPPDYFSADGQLWGNPLYDWDAMARTGFAWWIGRVRHAFDLFDVVRVDHFRGFESYWEVPGDATTAVRGRWVQAPGAALFAAIHAALGPLPIVAENLGIITPEVEALRERCGFPGMRILQFAFGDGAGGVALRPHHFPRASVVYTGTHDNDTTVGWWRSAAAAADTGVGDSTQTAAQGAAERALALRYVGGDAAEIHWSMIRTAMASVADTVIIPLQDILGLGSEARMNLPGRSGGNWGFRFRWEQLPPTAARRLAELTDTFER